MSTMKRHSQPPGRALGVPTSVTSSFLATETSSRSTAVPSQVEKQVSVPEPEVDVDLSALMKSSLENTGSPDAASSCHSPWKIASRGQLMWEWDPEGLRFA